MKDKTQVFMMGAVMILTIVLIVSIFAGQLNMETKASEEHTEETMQEAALLEENIQEEVVQEDVVQEDVVQEEPAFTVSEASYFDDALFIGDSRTVGLCEYGTLQSADYFASTGLSIYKLWEEKISVEDVGKVTLQQILEAKDYGKIYIMLGINELGYQTEKTIQKNEETIRRLKEKEPDAIIYVCANLHVTKARSDRDKLINNKKIDAFNEELRALTDNNGVYYIDVNEEFDDERGNLRAECTGDDVHVYAKYYQDWSDWLCKNTVQRGN